MDGKPALVVTCILVSAVTAVVTTYVLSQVRTPFPALNPRSQASAPPPATTTAPPPAT